MWDNYKAERGVWSEKMLIALKNGVKGNKWFSLIDKIGAARTLALAWDKVSANAGACGVDGITIGRFAKDSQSRLLTVRERIMKDAYQPQPARRTYIDKPGSPDQRPLGIPAVVDRVVQQSMRMVLEPIFEIGFAEHSYGFRPGRCCHDALRQVDKLLIEGHLHVVDIDIKGYFDNINHQRLMAKVAEKIADGRVLALLESFLKAGVLEEGKWTAGEVGTPQGGVISPLLPNIYLNDLDWEMQQSGHLMIRYADDMVILCASAEQAARALEQVRNWMEGAKLTLHPEKTRIVDMTRKEEYFDFLGYRFRRAKQSGKLLKLVRPKSERKMKEGIRQITPRCSGKSMTEIVGKISRKLVGWFNYFQQANRLQLSGYDSWIRMRLRSILRKRRKGKGRGGGTDHQRWPNSYFDQLGLYCLNSAKLEKISLLKGAKH